MNSTDFVNQLSSICPSKDILVKNGFTEKFADKIYKSYHPILKEKWSKDDSKNIIQILIDQYDISSIGFGDYRFEKELSEINGYKMFCVSSGTFLAFENANSEIFEFAFDDYSLVAKSAINGEAFLNATLILLDFKSHTLQFEEAINDLVLKESYFKRCFSAAGGELYSTFYKGIIFGSS